MKQILRSAIKELLYFCNCQSWKLLRAGIPNNAQLPGNRVPTPLQSIHSALPVHVGSWHESKTWFSWTFSKEMLFIFSTKKKKDVHRQWLAHWRFSPARSEYINAATLVSLCQREEIKHLQGSTTTARTRCVHADFWRKVNRSFMFDLTTTNNPGIN